MNNIIVISDTHCGCRLALCPPDPIPLDDGGTYNASKGQRKIWDAWLEFWQDWVPKVTKGEPFILVHNGDVIDGVHHGSTTQISHNIEDQKRIARMVMEPVIDMADKYYHIRGTEAHVGKSAEYEEGLARELGAVPDGEGHFARWFMWGKLGTRKKDAPSVHFTHHIGTTGRTHYESSAVMAEIGEMFVESGRWGEDPPDVIVRSHRHRNIQVNIPSDRGYCIAIVTPGWQLKTPFVHKIPGGRVSEPQMGGILIRHGDEDDIYTRSKVIPIKRPKPVIFSL